MPTITHRFQPHARLAALGGLALTAAACMTGCDQADASSMKIKLRADFSGEVMTSTVGVREPGDGPAQKASSGVSWRGAGSIVMARGEFDNINRLGVGGITFAAGPRAAGPGVTAGDLMVSITIPRGPDAAWPDLFTVRSAESRVSAARALNPAAKNPVIGDAVRIHVEVPGTVISAGATVRKGGIASAFEETTATLTIPIEMALTAGEPITWHITWKEPTVR